MAPRKQRKIYVLDTSVLLHDHNSINSFEDNYVAVPITVLEELDKFKVGNENKKVENTAGRRSTELVSDIGNNLVRARAIV
jgi:PhoH-like ATPase